MMEIPLQLLSVHIDRGAILHSYGFEDIDHGKFFVIVGVSKEMVAGFFYINSNINRYIYSKPELFAMQCPIKKEDYPFLKYDSFICGSDLIKLPKSIIVRQLQEDKAQFVGRLKDDDMTMLLEAARKSEIFNKADIRSFFY